MGLCVNCKYHTLVSNSGFEHKDGMRIFRPAGHYCNNSNYLETDFVTGETTPANCYFKNAYEECQLFEDIESTADPDNSDTSSSDTSDTSSTDTGDTSTSDTSDTSTSDTGDTSTPDSSSTTPSGDTSGE